MNNPAIELSTINEVVDILVLDKNFFPLSYIDTFESFLWVDRYNQYGDFEIYGLFTDELLKLLQIDNYLLFNQSEHAMIIDEVKVTTDVEEGNKVIIKGRSLENILYRRSIIGQIDLDGNLQNVILQLLNQNIIAPLDPNRRIPNFIFMPSTDPKVTNLNVTIQFTDVYLYDAIFEICTAAKIGFRIILNDNNQFVFSLYSGENRSYSQDVNDYVVFSPEFDNLLNSNYSETNRNMKNVALIAGEGEGSERIETIFGNGIGLERREMFVDASDISSERDDKTIMTPSEYKNLLIERGILTLEENKHEETFEGEIEPKQQFIFNKDFFIGDVVQIENEFGKEAATRFIEIIYSKSLEGFSVISSFKLEE